MGKLKSANHHWWPRCVSVRWAAADGKVGWLKPDGSNIRVPPKDLGSIRNAHNIKMGPTAGESTHLDQSFEGEFDQADRNFPSIISWLESLDHTCICRESGARFIPACARDEQLRLLTECAVSLAVRSPMNREASVALAEQLRGRIPSAERRAIIGLNMRRSQRLAADAIGANGKFVVLFSKGREFIFGDGFFHNIRAVVNPPLSPKLLAPLTPMVSVVVVRPTTFTVAPKLFTIVLSDDEVDQCNHAVQVYSRKALYYRSEQPAVEDAYACGQHREYSSPNNPIDNFLDQIPGVPQRNRALDFLFDRAAR